MNPHSLYDLGNEYNAIMADIEANDGELTPELEARHDEIVARLSTSAVNVAAALEMCDGAVADLDRWIEKLDRRRRAIEREKDRWKEAAMQNMASMGINELSGFANGLEIKLQIRESESVELDPHVPLPEIYTTTKTTVQPNKLAIKAALKSGAEIGGAQLVRKPFLVVRS